LALRFINDIEIIKKKRKKELGSLYGHEREAWWRVAVDLALWFFFFFSKLSKKKKKRFGVGDGTKISFCHDQWCREAALKVAFPVLFGFDCAKDTSIAVYLEFLGGSNKWNVSFARAAQDWKVDVFVSFY
jgi:hypothetical protein